MDIPIGTQYMTRGKAKRLCTVIDKHITTNMKGEIVRERYVSSHEFLGQKVIDYEVVPCAIKMGAIQV